MVARREFLKGLATGMVAGFPTIVPSSALGRGGFVAPSDRLLLGHIGIGSMGSGHFRRSLTIPDVRVVAVCDVRRDVRDKSKAATDAAYKDNSCTAYNDFRELMARPDLDAVLVATGERWHPLIAIEAARRGKHIYCEKPLGLSITECKAVRDAVNRSGIVFQFGVQQRASFNYRHTCELVRNGRLGELKTIMVGSVYHPPDPVPEVLQNPPQGFDWDMWLGPSPWSPYSEARSGHPWMSISDYGLGMIDGGWGIHDVDFAQWLNDADTTGPVEVEGSGVRFTDIRDAAYAWEVEYKYANGVRLIHMDLNTARKRAAQFLLFPRSEGATVVFGTKGWIFVSRQGIQSQPESLISEVIPPDAVRVRRSDNHTREFLDAIRLGRRTIAPVEVAVRDQTVSQQAEIAMRLGRKLRWDPANERFLDDADANRRLSRPMRSPWVL
jgi:predicted dehydrogenase